MIDVQTRLEPVLLAINSMRCRFEMALYDTSETDLGPAGLRAAGEEALGEIRRLDARLNVYSPTSELSRINYEAGAGPVRVSAPLFELLLRAKELSRRTFGAFDPTIGPLVRLWRQAAAGNTLPSPNSIRAARQSIRIERIEFDTEQRTIRFESPGMEMNLNALAKGYALDQAAARLHEAGVRCAFIQGGTSSGIALGPSPDGSSWRVGVADPANPDQSVETLALIDQAFGISSQTLQQSVIAGRNVGHVVSPDTGDPAPVGRSCAVIGNNAADADALSTALLVDPEGAANWLTTEETGLIVSSLESGCTSRFIEGWRSA